jgi:hypothetical protein
MFNEPAWPASRSLAAMKLREWPLTSQVDADEVLAADRPASACSMHDRLQQGGGPRVPAHDAQCGSDAGIRPEPRGPGGPETEHQERKQRRGVARISIRRQRKTMSAITT